MIILIVSLIVVLGLIVAITNFAFKQSIVAERKDKTRAIEILKKRNLYNDKTNDLVNSDDFLQLNIKSRDGYNLKGYYYNFFKDTNKVIIILHGYTANHFIQMPFVELFRDRGYNVLMIDNRSHGDSEGKYATYGKFESEDLKLWVEYIRGKFSKDTVIGLHGQSMGAATALMYAGEYNDIDFVISDCGYSDGKKLMKFQLKDKNKLPMFPFYNLINLKVKRACKFDFDEISPINKIKDCKVPIMFIHGDADTTVPSFMSEDMFEIRKNHRDMIMIVENAEHMVCYAKDKIKYIEALEKFLFNIEIDKNKIKD